LLGTTLADVLRLDTLRPKLPEVGDLRVSCVVWRGVLGMRHRKMSFAGEMGVWEVWAGGVGLPAIGTGTVLQW
ncbi:hypothetical protein ABT116_39395, partial [Streptomyces sp. NPDC002130]|uniref:hypothetical protein n=1 Tax=Streptomyces sp. NPDC002130 TaxID=3155568 RepID=UPI0033292BC4